MPYLSFPGDRDYQLAEIFAAECAREGLWLHPRHNWFMSAAHTEADIAQALKATERAFASISRHSREAALA
jgi:glutamate-1-semialdehyde 2,1-aminomutase